MRERQVEMKIERIKRINVKKRKKNGYENVEMVSKKKKKKTFWATSILLLLPDGDKPVYRLNVITTE